MEIKRINSYDDPRFSKTTLKQHGCFLADNMPYEIEIVGEREAVIHGEDPNAFSEIIGEFRFYTPHITKFYDEAHNLLKTYTEQEIFTIALADIQPSQFYVDEDKITAVSSFINAPEDIIIQVMKHGDRYISLDGHTRLYYAVMQGWDHVRAVEETSNDYIYGFVEESIKRGIYTPYDMEMVCHEEYEVKWNQFCDDFFANNNG